MKKLIPFLMGAILIAGCEQDPLKNASDSVRNGNLPDSEKMEPQKPLPKDALQVDAPGKYNGRVNFPIEIKVAGRVLIPDVPFTLIAANLQKFPGATFDSATGVFKWTPTKEFMNGQLAVMENLEVVMKTLPGVKNYPESTESKIIPILVSNSYDRPIINTVIVDQAPMKEITRVPFTMEDQDAANEKDLNLVMSECGPTSYGSVYPSLGTYVQVDRKSFKPGVKAGQYTGERIINLLNIDFIQDARYCLALQAISKFGVPSMPFEKIFSVTPGPREPASTLPRRIVLKTGEINRISFAVYDSSGFGRITVPKLPSLAEILPGSSITCAADSSPRQMCNMVIDTMTTTPGEYAFIYEVNNSRNAINSAKSFNFDIVVTR